MSSPGAPAETAAAAGGRASSLRVLVADDSEVSRLFLQRHLELLGCRTETAGGGREALACMREKPWDAVLMDCEMPELDGPAAVREWRAFERSEPRGARLWIIALTASADDEQRARCFAAGVDDYVVKSFDPAPLREALARCPASRTHEPPPANLETVRNRGLGVIVPQLISLFRTKSPALIAEIRSAVEAADPTRLAHAAHALRGSCSHLDARAMAAVCAELEACGRAGTVAGADRLLDPLEQAFLQVDDYLQKWTAAQG